MDKYENEMVMDKQEFTKQASIVIDHLEGGFWCPEMIADGRCKDSMWYHKGPGRSESGTTLFGWDRVNGADLIKQNLLSGNAFWALIDKLNANKTWHYNYRGGEYESELRGYLCDVMFPAYDNYSKHYLTGKAQSIVNTSDRLTFHMAYAVWNGPGFFEHFAHDLNIAVANVPQYPEVKDVNALVEIAKYSRLHSVPLIQRSAPEIISLMSKMVS